MAATTSQLKSIIKLVGTVSWGGDNNLEPVVLFYVTS